MKEVRAMSDQERNPDDPAVDFMRASLADARAELEKTREELAKAKERAENAEKEVYSVNLQRRDAWDRGYTEGFGDGHRSSRLRVDDMEKKIAELKDMVEGLGAERALHGMWEKDREALLARLGTLERELEWQMQRAFAKPKPKRSDKPVLVAQSGDRRVVRKPYDLHGDEYFYVMEELREDSMGGVKWEVVERGSAGGNIHRMMSLIEGLEAEA